MTAGQSGHATVAAKQMFKAQMKKGLKGMKNGIKQAAAREARNFIKSNVDRVSNQAVDYLMAHHSP